MIKRLVYLALSLAVLTGCQKDDDDDGKAGGSDLLTLDRHRIEVPAAGETISVEVTSNVAYEVTIPEAFREWISAAPDLRAETTESRRFVVAANDGDAREGYIVFAGGSLKDTVHVVQSANAGGSELLTLDKHRFEVSTAGETISVEVTSNVAYEVTIPEAFREWISAAPDLRAETTKSHRFVVAASNGDAREGYIVFAGGSLKDTVHVVQRKSFTESVSGVSFDMIYVQGGTFSMGATEEQQGEEVYDREMPVHNVTLSDYYIGKFEVTQELWEKVMGKNTSFFDKGGNYPADYVSWDSAQEFIAKLNELTGRKYALPTEAQWEYAARGGAKSKGYKYSGGNDIDEVAWYYDNSEQTTHPVGTKLPNELGIYDMSGNVNEWCSDRYGGGIYYNECKDGVTDPVGPATGTLHILRGGDWGRTKTFSRVSYRFYDYPNVNNAHRGLRLVLVP